MIMMNPHFSFQAGSATDIGVRYDVNQDYFMVDVFKGIFMVADGVGGGPAGDVASHVAINAAYDCLNKNLDMLSQESAGYILERTMEKSHQTIQAIYEQVPEYRGMGTTLLIAWLPGRHDHLWITHVGDCRCYRVYQGEVEQLTFDHTVFNAVKDANLLPEDPERWPSRSLLSQTMGASDIIAPQNIHREVNLGEFYFLCTDGIFEVLEQEEIDSYLTQPGHPELICEGIVQAALNNGAKDNLTAVGFRLRPFEAEQDLLAASLEKTVMGG